MRKHKLVEVRTDFLDLRNPPPWRARRARGGASAIRRVQRRSETSKCRMSNHATSAMSNGHAASATSDHAGAPMD
eukprot:1887535-Pyramimonas_sp.AAC.1